MSKTQFKMPSPRPLAAEADAWVGDTKTITAPTVPPTKAARSPTEKQARLTIDLPAELHALFKATCAMKKTGMVEVVREFIEEWTQKNR
jgi:hypothetical protein